MNFRNLLLSLALVLGAIGVAPAATAAPTGWYMSLGAGVNWIEDGDINEVKPGCCASVDPFSWDTGWIGTSAIGYDLGHWRVEFEVAYRQNDADSYCEITIFFTSCGDPVGDMDIWELSQMVNVLYDIPIGGNFSASVGAGVGGNLVVFHPDSAGGFDSSAAGLDTDDYVFAGQLIAQVAYRLSSRWEVYADYHFMFMDDPSFEDPTDVSEHFDMEKTDHALLIGFRLDLQGEGLPPPPPEAPAPPPESPREFIVFFGFNKANLTAEAARVVADAAEAAEQSGAAVLVVGHTDTSGSQAYNLRLSMRRADAVKGGLVQNGVPADMVTVSGKGEDDPMVQTGDGVKEPQNRRAVIILRIRTS